MDAIVTVEFTLRNVCTEEELKENSSFENIVQSLIIDEGLLNLCCGGSMTIVSIEQV